MNKVKISIIVPVYNVEKYLARCLESIMKQTLKEIEVIMVNDGSGDASLSICNEYKLKDKRFKLINKENGGLSEARNYGIKQAIGEYLLFVDSDDFIEINTCEILYPYIENQKYDIVVGDAKRIEGNNVTYMRHCNESVGKDFTGISFLKKQLAYNRMHMAAWLNMYSREFILNNKLFFKEGIYHEDEQWTPRVFLKAAKVKYVKTDFYNYIIREGSITTQKNKFKNANDLISTCYELSEIYKKISDKKLKKLLNNYLVSLFLHAIHQADIYNDFKSIKTKKFLINKPYTIKNKIKVFLFFLNSDFYKKLNNFEKIGRKET